MRDHARRLPGREGRGRARGLRDDPGREDPGVATADRPAAFVCLIEVRLHVAGSDNLKSKRKVVRSVKDAVRERLGAAVAEIDGQDTWQRSTLLCALVGRSEGELAKRADALEGIVVARAGEGCSFEREVRSLEDLRG